MKRQTKRRSPPGTSPGTLIIDPLAPKPVITLTAYENDRFISQEIHDLNEIRAALTTWPKIWVNVVGLGDQKTLLELGQIFSLHPLALEDVVNVHQRPKVDDYVDYQFIVSHLVTYEKHLKIEQVSFFLGHNFVLSFLETPNDNFKGVTTRLNNPKSRIRQSKIDYLFYELLDGIIDSYFPVLDRYGDRLDVLEDETVLHPGVRSITKIHHLKRDFMILKRDVWSQRDVLKALSQPKNPFVQEETRIYFRDCYDHTVQLMELLETCRERSSSLTDIHLSSVSNRMNEIMKVLTIIATIFMPMSFLAAIWGMNFSPESSPWNMPELRWYYGYPFALGLMFLSALGFIVYFWAKGWFSSKK